MKLSNLPPLFLLLTGHLVANDGVSFDRDIRPILSDKCFHCHGNDPKTRDSDLRLDTFEGATADLGGYAAIVPGDVKASELVLRIETEDSTDLMPPPKSHLKLTVKEKDLIKRWIASGAKYQGHWAYQPVQRPAVPEGEHPVDHFIQRKLAQENLTANPPADSRALSRRLALDLTGLPLPPERTAQFEIEDRNNRDKAVSKLVNELFQSPHYGERMAWDWMEVSRYADTNGYQGDRERTMWPWRDWVVRAFQQNLSWDQFTIWQLAGDLLPNPTEDQILATGFNRNFPINAEGGRISEENRIEYVFDMTETMGTTWLGLTLECSRCHDHKFDPISQRDYYSLNAFFNQTPISGDNKTGQAPPLLPLFNEQQTQQLKKLQGDLDQLQKELTIIDKKDPRYKEALAKRDAVEKKHSNYLNGTTRVMVMEELAERRPTYVLQTGLYSQRREEVDSAIPAVFGSLPKGDPANRLGLAKWLVNSENPLSPRVTVNRFWQQFFGTGLVKTSEDFGTQGERPTHPELMDWLAAELVESGWDVQHLIRSIVTSKTYQQSAIVRPEHLDRDLENRLLARSPRHRLPAWMLRDQALATSGLLVPKVGGYPVKPYQPAGIWAEATFGKKEYVQDTGEKLYRRSLYTFWRRIAGPPSMFDTADRLICEVKTSRTNTPLQALTTMNDLGFVEASRLLAQDTNSIGEAFARVVNREPSPAEEALLESRIAKLRTYYQAHPEDATKLLSAGEAPLPEAYNPADLAARTAVGNLLYNLDEVLCRP